MPADRPQWAAYAIEAVSLGFFIVSALVFTALLEHPGSPVRAAMPHPLVRRALIGVAMGLTAAAIVYSPWGQRSGAHLNPSITLAYLRLGRVGRRDAALYVLAQFVGGIAGIAAAVAALRPVAGHPAVNYVATVPGAAGAAAAFGGELAISFLLMLVVLRVSSTPHLARFTGAAAACLVALYITVEAPVSGMSMNPARSFGPALAAGATAPLWIYFTAPPLGMLLAAELFLRRQGHHALRCAKLHHPTHGFCHLCGGDGHAATASANATDRTLADATG